MTGGAMKPRNAKATPKKAATLDIDLALDDDRQTGTT
jgi:hypothetical protein